MNRETLGRLEMLNQIKLSEAQKDDVISFFAKREADLGALDTIDTSNTEGMVHAMPTAIALREDDTERSFSREALQTQAPATDAGYWCVPRVIE